MKKLIAKQILIILLIVLCKLTYAQKGKAVLILKDNTRINGIGEISGISSIVTVKFKNDTLKYRTYKPKEISGIDILENNYYRKFRYKYKDGGKFSEILEIVSIDNLSLYIRIYEESALSNSFSNEFTLINDEINRLNNNHLDDETNPLSDNYVQEIELDNGKKIKIGKSINKYREINFPRLSYYVGKRDSDQVEHLYTKGLPFAKSFKKSIKKYFKNCPSLLEKVENKEFSNDELWKVIDFYNRKCLEIKQE